MLLQASLQCSFCFFVRKQRNNSMRLKVILTNNKMVEHFTEIQKVKVISAIFQGKHNEVKKTQRNHNINITIKGFTC